MILHKIHTSRRRMAKRELFILILMDWPDWPANFDVSTQLTDTVLRQQSIGSTFLFLPQSTDGTWKHEVLDHAALLAIETSQLFPAVNITLFFWGLKLLNSTWRLSPQVPFMIFGTDSSFWMLEIFAACFWIANIPISWWIASRCYEHRILGWGLKANTMGPKQFHWRLWDL